MKLSAQWIRDFIDLAVDNEPLAGALTNVGISVEGISGSGADAVFVMEIGTNRPDGYEVGDQIAAQMPAGSSESREGSAGLKRLLESRGVMPTDYDDWRKIEETEVGRARPGSPREKFVRHQDWLQVLGR